MNVSDREMKNLTTRLSEAYHQRSDRGMPVDDHWLSGVMQSVRSVGPHGNGFNAFYSFIKSFGDFTWRLMPAALVLLIFLSVMVRFIDASLQYQVNSLITADPVGIYDITNFFYGV